jgi:hypothetical protein
MPFHVGEAMHAVIAHDVAPPAIKKYFKLHDEANN